MADLIDRQAAIDAILSVTGNSSVRELYEHVQEHGLSDMWSGGVNAAIDIIIALPSTQPERKTGKWILIKGSNGKDYHKCSKCLHTQEITGVKNYCAVCGADMRGEKNEPNNKAD